MKPFEVSRLRLNMAKEHGASLAEIWNSLLAEEMLAVRIKADVITGKGRIEGYF